MTQLRIIAHVDIDAFYPAVEIRENPTLRGKPVIVGADPKQGAGRGVVMSCSYEARRFGVHSGQPISQAYRLCPQGNYVRPNFSLYERVSDNVMKILRRYADKLEQTGIEEAYLEVTDKTQEIGSVEALAAKLKEDLFRREQLTCSIGVAPNKIVAKIASDQQKPNGLTIVDVEQVLGFLEPLPVSRIPGVGPKTQAALAGLGIGTIGQLRKYSAEGLVRKFGKNGIWLSNVARGIDESPVIESWEAKSLSSETTFDRDEENRAKVVTAAENLVAEIYQRLVIDGYRYKTVGIKIRFEDFETHTKAKSTLEYTNSKETLLNLSRQLIHEYDGDPRKVRLIGVRVSNLRKEKVRQATLLSWA